jgi:homoserine kinase type II
MAVFTKWNIHEIEELFSSFSNQKISKVLEIKEGSENSNYLVIAENQQKFIFTIFEKRLDANYLPFYLELLKFLDANQLIVPLPLYSSNYKNKNFAFFSFLEGKSITHPNFYHIQNLVINLAKLHKKGAEFAKNYTELTPQGVNFLHLYNKYLRLEKHTHPKLKAIMQGLVKDYYNLDTSSLRQAIIHGDLFRDNVFFLHNKFSGFIDFFFARKDYLVCDLAIVINDWCFYYHNNKLEFNLDYYLEILTLYKYYNHLNKKELEALKFFLKTGALTFYLSRLEDKVRGEKKLVNSQKDPNEYLQKLFFHTEDRLKFIHF